jgi:hypothetical protein
MKTFSDSGGVSCLQLPNYKITQLPNEPRP